MKKEETIIIIGNGPSMKIEYFDLLKSLEDIHTFGMNAAYRYWKIINWYPTYYCCFDYAVTLSHKDEIKKLILDKNIPIKKYFLLEKPTIKSRLNHKIRYFDEEIRKNEKYIEKKHNKDFFGQSQDPDDGKHPIKYSSTGCGSIRCAIEMGFKNIILLGMDGNYSKQIIPESKKNNLNKLEIIKTPNKNPNYFWKDYQQKGDLYNIPGNHLLAWKELTGDIKKYGINIINCSEGSKIPYFSKDKFENVIKQLD